MELTKEINKSLYKGSVSAKTLLNRFIVLKEMKNSASYFDPGYLPFYYYLGRHLTPSSLLEIGVGNGLCSGLFLAGCKSVSKYLGCQPTNEFYPKRIAVRNIKTHFRKKAPIYQGSISDKVLEDLVSQRAWDLCLLVDRYDYEMTMQILNLFWSNTSADGHIVVDFVKYEEQTKRAYKDFCHIKNRPENYFKTKYGVGIIQR